jgi:hypothetical protein
MDPNLEPTEVRSKALLYDRIGMSLVFSPDVILSNLLSDVVYLFKGFTKTISHVNFELNTDRSDPDPFLRGMLGSRSGKMKPIRADPGSATLVLTGRLFY